MTHVDPTLAQQAEPVITDLGNVITSPTARQVIYGLYTVALIVLGGVVVAFAAIGHTLPQWAIVANAVIGYLGIPVGSLAVVNVKKG